MVARLALDGSGRLLDIGCGPTIPPWTVDRSVDDVVASIYSLSSSAPHLFGKKLSAFGVELRGLLNEASNGRAFSERMSQSSSTSGDHDHLTAAPPEIASLLVWFAFMAGTSVARAVRALSGDLPVATRQS